MLPIISLASFIGVIFLSSLIKKNAGVIAMIVSYLLGIFVVGMKAKAIYAGGWPTSVFFIILATTFLFGIASVNGTTHVLAQNVICLARGNRRIVPLLFFTFSAIISGAGAGGLIVAVIMPIALTVADEYDIPVLMMSLVTMGGIMVGGLSPLAINGIVAKQLSFDQGIANYANLWLAYGISMSVFSLLAFLLLGGLKLKSSSGDDTSDAVAITHAFTRFNRQQKMTIGAVCVVVAGVIFFKQNIGLISFACAGLLVLLGAADQKKAIAAIPWSALLLISGMAILINVVTTAGGIEFLSGKLSGLMGVGSAQPIMVVLGGLLGAVSSGTGVAMPTLIPLGTELAAELGGSISAQSLIVGVLIGINGVVISPLSTVGAIAVASAPESVNKDKLYNELLISAISFIVLNTLASAVGLFGFFS